MGMTMHGLTATTAAVTSAIRRSLYWLRRISVREKGQLDWRRPPLSLGQIEHSHRSKGEAFSFIKENTEVGATNHQGRHTQAAGVEVSGFDQ
jgi:hypothetical protein